MDNSNYDDLMKAAQQKLEYEKNGTLNNDEDIYASLREDGSETDTESTGKPNLSEDFDYQERPEVEFEEIEKEDYYIDPNDSPVFEDGPGISKVQLWKKQYGINRVYHVKILEKHYLFRTLNRSEYEQIASLALDSLTNEELICKTCVLWPLQYNYETMAREEAGFPSTLAQIIMENSGFTNEYGIEVL